MSIQIQEKNTVPPGGFRYTVPETKLHIKAPSWSDLGQEVRKHYKANGLVIPLDLDDLMQAFMCAVMPPGICKHDGKSIGLIGGLTFERVKQGTATLVEWFGSGRQRVDAKEAERRIQICSACNFNQPPDGCSACNMSVLHGLIEKIVGGEKVSGEAHIHACAICGCALKAKIRLPLDVIQNNTPPDVDARFPSFCWAKKTA